MKRRDFLKLLGLSPVAPSLLVAKGKKRSGTRRLKPAIRMELLSKRLKTIDRSKSYGKICVLCEGDLDGGAIRVYDINIDAEIIDMNYNMLVTEEQFNRYYPGQLVYEE